MALRAGTNDPHYKYGILDLITKLNRFLDVSILGPLYLLNFFCLFTKDGLIYMFFNISIVTYYFYCSLSSLLQTGPSIIAYF